MTDHIDPDFRKDVLPCDNASPGDEVATPTVATLCKDVFGALHEDLHNLECSHSMAITSGSGHIISQPKSPEHAELEPGCLLQSISASHPNEFFSNVANISTLTISPRKHLPDSGSPGPDIVGPSQSTSQTSLPPLSSADPQTSRNRV